MSDTRAPVLLGLTLPSSIDLSSGSVRFNIGIQAQDEAGGSGIRYARVEFKSAFWEDGQGFSQVRDAFTFDYWSADNFHDATPTTAGEILRMSNLTRSGTYEIARIVLEDLAGNRSVYEPAQLQALGIGTAIAVTGGLVDTAAPSLVSLDLPASVDLSAGFSQVIRLDAAARDVGGAGAQALTITFDRPLTLADGPATTELRLTTLARAPDLADSPFMLAPALSGQAAPGVYNITNVRVSDYLGNVRDYSAAQLQAQGIATAMTIAGNPVPDPPAPETPLPTAALAWAMAEQGAVLTVTPDSWGTAPVNSVGLQILRDRNADRLVEVRLTGGATGELSITESDYAITIVGKGLAGIGPGAGIAVTMSPVYSGVPTSFGFAAFTINGAAHRGTGAQAVDYVRGTDAADRIDLAILPELVDGRDGLDTLRVHGARGDYQVVKSGDGFLLTPRYQPGTLLANVERIAFDDGHVALDTGGAPGQLYRLYQAAFDRAPDLGGIGHWLGRMEAGDSLSRIAGYFIASKEFADLAGTASADRDFVGALYDHVLHRAPDAGGLAFWVDVLGRGAVDRAQVLVEFSESPENVARLVGAIENGIDFLP